MSTFSFNGYDLTEYFKFIKAEHEIGNDRSISTDSAPKIGVNVQEVDFGPKKIKVTVSLSTRDLADMTFVDPSQPAVVDKGLFYRVREEAARVLHTDKAVRLQLPDEPDRYYLALPKGSIDLKGIDDWYDQATIEFLVPDGVAHSLTYRTFSNPKREGNKLTFALDNQGSVNAQPIITVKHNSENGYIGLVNPTGILEVGDRQESDGEEFKRSEVLFDYASSGGQDRIPNGLREGIKNIATTNNPKDGKPTGTLAIDNAWGRPHIALQSGNIASLTWNIPADSSGVRGGIYEYFFWRQIFWAGTVMDQGSLKITVHAENNEFLYGVETWKRSNGLSSEYNFMAGDGRGGYKILASKRFECTHVGAHNPFNEPGGWSDIQRFDDILQFHYFGSYPRFAVPEIKGKRSAKINVTFTKLDGHPTVRHMYIDQFIYRKDYVTGYKDIPNRYRMGSTVVLDSEQDFITVDNIKKVSDVVQGSNFITIPPGKSQLEVYTSSWIKQPPTVEVKFEERYL